MKEPTNHAGQINKTKQTPPASSASESRQTFQCQCQLFISFHIFSLCWSLCLSANPTAKLFHQQLLIKCTNIILSRRVSRSLGLDEHAHCYAVGSQWARHTVPSYCIPRSSPTPTPSPSSLSLSLYAQTNMVLCRPENLPSHCYVMSVHAAVILPINFRKPKPTD